MVPLDITNKVQLIQAMYEMLGNEIAGLTAALQSETPAPTKVAADRNVVKTRKRGRPHARKRKSVAAPAGIRRRLTVPDPNKEYTVKEVSGFLARSKVMVLRYIKEGILIPEAKKNGRNYVIRGAEVIRFKDLMEADKRKGNGLSQVTPPATANIGA